jgi:hypothetical protein
MLLPFATWGVIIVDDAAQVRPCISSQAPRQRCAW